MKVVEYNALSNKRKKMCRPTRLHDGYDVNLDGLLAMAHGVGYGYVVRNT